MRDLILKFIFQEMRLSRDVFIIHDSRVYSKYKRKPNLEGYNFGYKNVFWCGKNQLVALVSSIQKAKKSILRVKPLRILMSP